VPTKPERDGEDRSGEREINQRRAEHHRAQHIVSPQEADAVERLPPQPTAIVSANWRPELATEAKRSQRRDAVGHGVCNERNGSPSSAYCSVDAVESDSSVIPSHCPGAESDADVNTIRLPDVPTADNPPCWRPTSRAGADGSSTGAQTLRSRAEVQPR
jgi:hypothetical protein